MSPNLLCRPFPGLYYTKGHARLHDNSSSLPCIEVGSLRVSLCVWKGSLGYVVHSAGSIHLLPSRLHLCHVPPYLEGLGRSPCPRAFPSLVRLITARRGTLGVFIVGQQGHGRNNGWGVPACLPMPNDAAG